MDDQTTGVLLAIDDGYGTLTDADVRGLGERLTAEGHDIVIWDYQVEDMPAGYFVARYESGQYGATSLTNPYIAVLLYVVDYFDAAHDISALIAEGSVVLALNFATSVVAREAVKFSSQPERAAFYLWADQMLFDTFGLKRPNKTVLINGEAAEVSVKSRVFTEMSGVFSRDYKVIDAYRNGHRLVQEDIDRLVMETIRSVLPEPPLPESAGKNHVTVAALLPELPDSVSEEYRQGIADLLTMRDAVVEQLKEAGAAKKEWQYAQALLTPMAVQPIGITSSISQEIETVGGGYSQDHTAVKLVDHWPKNEFDLLPTLLFPHSSISTTELVARLDKLPFEQKDALLRSLLSEAKHSNSIKNLPISYTFELLTSFKAQSNMREQFPDVKIISQKLSPRYEYEMPDFIETYGVADAYMDCFERSMKLHGRFEATEQQPIAANACLIGSRLRWQLKLSLGDVAHYQNQESFEEQKAILKAIRDKLRELHPYLIDQVDTLE